MTYNFDKNITVGSFITAYEKGFHIVTYVGPGPCSSGTLVRYKRVLSEKGAKSSGAEKQCDGAWCELVTPQRATEMIDEKRKEFETFANNIAKYVGTV